MKLRTLLALGLALVAVPAFAGVRVNLGYSPTYSMPASGTGGFGAAGGGATFNIDFTSRFGLDLGGAYQTFTYGGTGYGSVFLPGAFRFWITKWLGLDVGGFYRQFLTPKPAPANTYSVGVNGGLVFDIPVGGKVGILLRANYAYALTTGTTAMSQAWGLVGIRIGAPPMGGK